MKRYVIIVIILLAILSAYNIFSIYTGIYINFNRDEIINNNVFAKDGKIYVDNKEFKIKGVEINSSYPGYNFSDYEIDKETYLKWLEQIQDMGANTIKATCRLNPEFYQALYDFNEHKKMPLYLIQCIDLEEYKTNNSESIYGFKDKLIKECLATIDVIHGNRYIVASRGITSSGLYSKDVSKWTIGYIINSVGKEETIAYTDYTYKRNSDKGYNGKYFYTNPQEASETEYVIAEIMDKMAQYETEKYNEQRLISLMLNFLKDPFKYKQNINAQLGKMAYIDMSNIKTTEKLKTGKLISYDMSGEIVEFINNLDEKEKEKYSEILNTVQTDTIYEGYIDFINKYYKEPVLIASYGFSTSRISTEEFENPLTEREQGEEIIHSYNEFMNLGVCGGIISSWQDNWAITTWNVKYSTIEEKEVYWFNKQSIDQCKGIVTFEIENRENVCYVDGEIGEWTEEQLILENNGVKLYGKYDLENVYIMAKNIKSDILYIPIDTTPNSGATTYMNYKYDKAADFVIKIDGTENSEILVQEYYDSIRAMYEDNITGIRQFTDVPRKDTNNFVSMRAILRKKIDPTIDIIDLTNDQRKLYRMYKVNNVGKLRHGKNNPNSLEYNSLADFCFGENCVEIQIPWQLLNFSSPSEMLIHDDYYKNYGVEDIKIEEMYIGIGQNNLDKIIFGRVELDDWKTNVKVQERLKKSYDIIKRAWSGE